MVVAAAGRLRGAVGGNADVQRDDQALQGGEEGGGAADYRCGAAEALCVREIDKELMYDRCLRTNTAIINDTHSSDYFITIAFISIIHSFIQ